MESGVTAMRAFVEVDTTVGFTCLDMGLQLAKEWVEVCHIQIVGLQPSVPLLHFWRH